MKNLILEILNTFKTQAKHLEKFSVVLTLPIIFNTTALPISLPTVKVESEEVKIQDEKLTQIAFDATNPHVIILNEKRIEITLGESNFDKELKTIRLQRRNVIARDRYFGFDPGLAQKRALAQAAASRFGVPWQIVEAVWQVESGKSWDTSRTSYAGATGPMQFLPSTFRKYGVDANGDGRVDITSAYDSVYAGANLLAQNGAASGRVEQALFCYNHSWSYVNKVLGVARSIGY